MAEKLRVKRTDVGFEFWCPDDLRGRFMMDTTTERLSLVVHQGRAEIVNVRMDIGAMNLQGLADALSEPAMQEYVAGLFSAARKATQGRRVRQTAAATDPEELDRIRRAHDAASTAYAQTLVAAVKADKGKDPEAVHAAASKKAAEAGQEAYNAVMSEAGTPVAAPPVYPS